MARTHFNGPVASRSKESDGGLWIPATVSDFYTGTWTKTRGAAGNYFMRKTSGAQAGQAVFYVGAWLLHKIGADPNNIDSPHDIRGFEVKAIDLVYGVGTANLVSHTFDLIEATFANNAAVALDDAVGGALSGTLAIATQASPYVTQIGVGTPFVVGRNVALRNLVLEIAWDAAATSVLDYYGAYVRYNYNLL